MKLAILAGFNVLVPQGKLVGGTFKSTPLCSRPGQTGCVISLGQLPREQCAAAGRHLRLCRQAGNDRRLRQSGAAGIAQLGKLDSYWYARSTLPVPGGPIVWSTEGPPPTPYLRTEGLVSARCVNDGPRGYLSVRTNADPRDKRTDRVGGEVGLLGFFLPGWGMHLADISEAQGDLIRTVAALSPKR